ALRGECASVPAASFIAWRERAHSFAQLVPVEYRNFTLITGDRPAEQVTGERLSAAFFPALAVRMLLGRPFSNDEDEVGKSNVVVLNEKFWRSRFNADSSIVGKTIRL